MVTGFWLVVVDIDTWDPVKELPISPTFEYAGIKSAIAVPTVNIKRTITRRHNFLTISPLSPIFNNVFSISFASIKTFAVL